MTVKDRRQFLDSELAVLLKKAHRFTTCGILFRSVVSFTFHLYLFDKILYFLAYKLNFSD